MTELLSKEKEFVKLNEELNRIASNSLHQRHQDSMSTQQLNRLTSHQKRMIPCKSPQKQPNTISSKAQDSRHDKSTKTKMSTLQSRRRAGGDGNGMEQANDRRKNYCQGISYTTTTTVPGEPAQHTQTCTNRKLCPRNVGESSRPTSQRVRQSHNTNFTVRYRNPKFVESPSLEVLVRDEYSSMRCEYAESSSNSKTTTDDVTVKGHKPAIDRKTSNNSSYTSQKHANTDGLIKYLKSKIVILEEDHEKMTQEAKQQKDLLDRALERSKKLEQQRDQAYAKHNSVVEQLKKMEIQLEEVTSKLKERSTEQITQQKELEMARRELKIVNQSNSNLEKRLCRATEDVESARNTLALMKNVERELKESSSRENEGKDKQIRSLKKQRADLLNAYKKQLFLIDNLKRQNICMEQSKMLSFSEKEFTKILEWKLNG